MSCVVLGVEREVWICGSRVCIIWDIDAISVGSCCTGGSPLFLNRKCPFGSGFPLYWEMFSVLSREDDLWSGVSALFFRKEHPFGLGSPLCPLFVSQEKNNIPFQDILALTCFARIVLLMNLLLHCKNRNFSNSWGARHKLLNYMFFLFVCNLKFVDRILKIPENL